MSEPCIDYEMTDLGRRRIRGEQDSFASKRATEVDAWVSIL